MPCRVDPTPEEIEASNRARHDRIVAEAIAPFQERNDRLTHENDMLREVILESLASGSTVVLTEEQAEAIRKNQVAHLVEDLQRLNETLQGLLDAAIASKNLAGMAQYASDLFKVQNADPTMPLQAQLGFDPDSY